MPLLLTEADVRAVLAMPELIDAMEGALARFSSGGVVQPVRSVLDVGTGGAFFGLMPAAVNDPPSLGAKLVTVYESNHARGLPSHLASIVLLDHATGAIEALLDGRYITEARTAAVSAVSVRHLARRDATTLGLIGSGVQARSHLEAISHVLTLTDVRVWSPSREHRERFTREMSARYPFPIRAVDNAGAASTGADVVVIATGSRTPVVRDEDVSPGAHICGVGACRPDQREMPSSLVARARVYVDSRAGALAESGDILLPMQEGRIQASHIRGELGDVVLKKAPGRIADADVTIFKSLGMAIEDIVSARLVVERARRRGLGQTFNFQ